MKIQRARSFRHGRIEIIPMIDVMFFLLVTFMLASLSMQSLNSISVNLPKGDAESLEHREPITLTVTHDNHIFIDKTPTTLEQLAFARNPGLAAGIEDLHRTGRRVFAAIGVLHMVGDKAVPKLLVARGFKVERVAFDVP